MLCQRYKLLAGCAVLEASKDFWGNEGTLMFTMVSQQETHFINNLNENTLKLWAILSFADSDGSTLPVSMCKAIEKLGHTEANTQW